MRIILTLLPTPPDVSSPCVAERPFAKARLRGPVRAAKPQA